MYIIIVSIIGLIIIVIIIGIIYENCITKNY